MSYIYSNICFNSFHGRYREVHALRQLIIQWVCTVVINGEGRMLE